MEQGRSLSFSQGRRLSLSRTLVMGILNCTPDSFYDGGAYPRIEDAVETALRMEAEGASVIDIGGESTRPGAEPVGIEEELARVIPVVEALRSATSIPISIDTSKALVAASALAAGADIVNDVTAMATDPEMIRVVAENDATIVLMHMKGSPGTMQQSPVYTDAVVEVRDYLVKRAEQAIACGIDRSRIMIDPGFGFGKLFAHNAALLESLHTLVDTGFPVLVGLSRKSMIEHAIGLSADERLEASLALAVMAAERGAAVVRTHDVLATVRAVGMTDAIIGERVA